MPKKNTDNDQYLEYVRQFMRQYIPLNEEDFQLLVPFLEFRQFAKKEQVLRYGQTDDYLNLVVKGVVRKYLLVDKEEKTLQLATEGHIIQSELSFHRRVPSTQVIETVEPSVLASMRYDHVQHMLDTFPQAELLGRLMITSLFIKKDQKYFLQLNTTTRERFLHYLRHHPDMLQRVPQKVLASFLEVKPETFSRLKHLLKS